MRPNAVRTAVLAAALSAASLAPWAVAPAHASGSCLAVTGTAVMPAWTFDLWPGVSQEPEPQSVRIFAGHWSGQTFGEVQLTCLRADGVSTFVGRLFVESATGASFGPEDLTQGAGGVDGMVVTATGVATLATVGVGTYGTSATATATGALTYVRAGASIAIVVTLRSFSVDVDGTGAIPPLVWGDVPLASAASATPHPSYVVSDYLFGRGLRADTFFVPSVPAVAAGT